MPPVTLEYITEQEARKRADQMGISLEEWAHRTCLEPQKDDTRHQHNNGDRPLSINELGHQQQLNNREDCRTSNGDRPVAESQWR